MATDPVTDFRYALNGTLSSLANGYESSSVLAADGTLKPISSGIPVTSFMLPTEGNDIGPAIARTIARVKQGLTSRDIVIPQNPSGFSVSSQALCDLSDVSYHIYSDISLSSTTRQKTLLFAHDANQAPAQALSNVSVFGYGHTINGNGAAMSFSYSHGDGSDNDSAVRFNRIDGVYVDGLNATNGPIDSFSLRQCRNWHVRNGTFTNSKEDNGFSATTDWGSWVTGDISTWGYGWAENCVAYNNKDLGMTAFNASGVWFKGCISYGNDGGYSYEDSFGAPNTKDYRGGFENCFGFNNRSSGFFIDADAVRVGDGCQSYNNRGTLLDNTNNLYEHGVLISNIGRVYVGGIHRNNGRSGIAFFNGATQPMQATVNAIVEDNDWHGIYGRGIGSLSISKTSEIKRNGLVLVSGAYGSGILVSNNGGSSYLQGDGLLSVDGALVEGNGLSAINSDYVKTVIVRDIIGRNNAASGSAIGVTVTNGTDAIIQNNHIPSTTGNQTFAVAINNSVTNGYEWGNTGTGSSGVAVNNATSVRQVMRQQITASATWDPASIAAGAEATQVISVSGADVGDYAAVSFSQDIGRLIPKATVTSAGNVTVSLQNFTGSAIDPVSGTVRVIVTKRNAG